MRRRSLLKTLPVLPMSLSAKSTKGRRQELYALLGDLPPRNRKVTAKLISKEETAGYVLEKLELDLNGIEPAPAYLAMPKGAKGKLPTVLYHHAHGGNYKLGKDEFLKGRTAIYKPPYAELLTEGRVPFSTLSKTPRLQRDVHGKTSAPSASSAFILLSSSVWVPKNGLIPHSRKESQTAEIREDAERLKYSLEIHVLNLLEENPLRSPRTLRLIFFSSPPKTPKVFIVS